MLKLLYVQRFFGLGLFFVPVGILFLLENGLSNMQVLFLAGFFGFMNVEIQNDLSSVVTRITTYYKVQDLFTGVSKNEE